MRKFLWLALLLSSSPARLDRLTTVLIWAAIAVGVLFLLGLV